MKFKSSHAINQRIESISTNHLIIGIDIAKEIHVAGAVNFRGIQLGRTLSFSNDYIGFEKLMKWVRDLQQTNGLTQVIYGAESTGHYFLNLAFWLHERMEKVVLVNPMTTKRNKENRDNKPSKNDAKDALTIADAVSRGYYSNWIVPEVVYRKLRCAVNEREALSIDSTALSNQIQTALDQAFPEFTSVIKQWNCPRGLATLKAFPLPTELKNLTAKQIVDGWYLAGMRRAGGSRGLQVAGFLLSAARRSVGLTDVAQQIKRQIQRLLSRYEDLQAQMSIIDQEIGELLNQIPKAARQPLETIGLSPWFVAVILANAGDPRNYTHGNQLLALAGLNLSERTSGKHKGQIKLSKRGRRQLRKYLYLAILGLVSNHEAFKLWHAHNVHVLKMKKQKSIFKLIGKLTRMIVSLAHSGETFDVNKASGQFDQDAA
ncbi:MAG: IS110 family transposase [Paenibacillaceae bacterium]